MKEFIILIIMFFADPMYKGKDSVSIKSYQDKPLVFDSLDTCEKWVWNDLENLKAYAKSVYPEAVAVKSIICVKKLGTDA
tara:strand:+ start:3091 stop:3330 length:240 start_codon:yes stop_codon:yes gene_type:complete